jgi:hypothetical protein
VDTELLRQRIENARNELNDCLLLLNEPDHPLNQTGILFGQRFSARFKAGLLWIQKQNGLDPNKLTPCMYFETGGTFSPSVKNMAGSGAVGLIQFMKSTAAALGTTTAKLATMDAVQQLGYVYRYFQQFDDDFSHYTLEDVYMCILYPKAVGKPNDWPMPWKYGSIAYKQNSGLDLNKDHTITKAEAAAGVVKAAALGEQFRG